MALLESLVTGAIALVPAATTLFLSYARYDGHFRDQTIFLFFLGGFALGMALAILDLALLASTAGLTAVLLVGLGAALAHAAAVTAALNRRKWQGERHAVFNGGALGCGISSVAILGYASKYFGNGIVPGTALALILLSVGYAGVHFALGLLIGTGVLDRRPFPVLALGAAGLVPLTLLILEFWHTTPPSSGWTTPLLFWGLLAAAYGVAAYLLASLRWLPSGLTPEARAEMRRAARAER